VAASAPSDDQRGALRGVLVATFFVRFAFGLTVVVYVAYITGHSNGFSGNDVGVGGLVSALAPLGELSTVLFSGYLADRHGRWPVLFTGMAGSALLFGLVALTRNVVALGAMNFLFGAGSGAILAASLAVVGDRAETEHRGYEMGRFDAMNLFGWTAGIGLGLYFLGALANGRLELVFLAGAGALAAGLVVTALLVRGIPVYHGARGYSLASVLGNVFRRSVLLVTLPWLVIYVLIGTALVFIGPGARGAGISTTLLGAVIGGGGALLVLTQPYFGTLADRWGRTRIMTLGAGGFVAAMGAACLLIAYGPTWPILALLGVSAVLALSYGPAALAALADLTRLLSRATTMAIYSLTISLGMVVGIFGSSFLYSEYANDGLYLFFGAVAAAMVGLTVARIADAGFADRPAPTTPAR
jgi:MFS transporter, DHA1 family, multidrug resistance protein